MILIAPTDFKETIPAVRAAAAIAAGALRVAPGHPTHLHVLSDGGPGLLDALERTCGGSRRGLTVRGPLGHPAHAELLFQEGRVVVESAQACGLHLIPTGARDPSRADTRGVGELVREAVRLLDASGEVVLGLGGSATVDGGAGMAAALGFRLLDRHGNAVLPGGGGLAFLDRIIPPPEPSVLPPGVRFVALADVDAPLCGERGAARVFGPQKGAAPDEVRRLDEGLARLAVRIETDLGVSVGELPGAGAAGGLGAGAVGFLGAEICPGSEWILRESGFDDLLGRADLLLTGEGTVDRQSWRGKVVGEVAARAVGRGIPVAVLAGRIEGPLPPGVLGLDGEGRILDEAGLAEVAARAVARLLAEAAAR